MFSGLLSIGFIFMLKKWAKIIVYTIFCLLWLSMVASIVILLIMLPKFKEKNNALTMTVILLSVFVVISICLVVFFHKKIAIACEIIKEASEWVKNKERKKYQNKIKFWLWILNLVKLKSLSKLILIFTTYEKNLILGTFAVLKKILN